MRAPASVIAAVTTLLVLAAPGYCQMVGGAGANVGQSPQDARETDQVFDDLKAKGAIQSKPAAPDELVVGADLVHREKYAEAIPHLENALARHPRDVNTLIYLGFSYRMMGAGLEGDAKAGAFAKALGLYRRGLEIDPRNKLLHEYTGKLYVLMHDEDSAQSELKELSRLCPSGCDEFSSLSSAIAMYDMAVRSTGSTPPAGQDGAGTGGK